MKYAQLGQDIFVHQLTNETIKGFFVEIGCQLPFHISNTLFLEKKGWKGIAIDLKDYSSS